jgi:hypothetical protein
MIPEPVDTTALRALLRDARARFTAAQREAMQRRDATGRLDHRALHALRTAGDPASLHAAAVASARWQNIAPVARDQLDGVTELLLQAADRPAVVSAVLWHRLRLADARLASLLIQLARERADLPGLAQPIAAADPALQIDSVPALATRFADRQIDDACAWIEHVPPPLDPAATLADQRDALEAARAGAPRPAADELTGFLQRAAAFLVQLSVAGVDPLGFPVGREAQLETDPPLPRRLAIAAWAHRAGHVICPRGQMHVLGLPVDQPAPPFGGEVDAPWPMRLELIAAELGCGVCGGLGVLLRLQVGDAMPATTRAPMLLCFASEPPEQRGARFERWLSDAYPLAALPWQAWI